MLSSLWVKFDHKTENGFYKNAFCLPEKICQLRIFLLWAFCLSTFSRSVDKPFFEEAEYEAEMATW